MALPGIDVSWTQISPPTNYTFVKYKVKRRITGESTWTVLAEITNVATVSYEDRTVASGVSYDYSVTWIANYFGSLLESADNTAADSCTFTSLWIHQWEDPDVFTELKSNSFSPTRTAETEMRSTWGRTKPTALRRERLTYDELTVDSIPLDEDDSTAIALVRTMQEELADTPLVLRLGGDPRVFFCVLNTVSETRVPGQYSFSLELAEIYVNEDVAA